MGASPRAWLSCAWGVRTQTLTLDLNPDSDPLPDSDRLDFDHFLDHYDLTLGHRDLHGLNDHLGLGQSSWLELLPEPGVIETVEPDL